MTRIFALTAASVAAAALACFALLAREQPQRNESPPPAAILQQTVLAVGGREPLSLPALTAADGTLFEPARLHGHWSVIFFGFTSCPHVCPTTLQVLGAAARDPASGVPAGTTQIVFVSVDPERDTPERLRNYLAAFDRRIVGLTGRRVAVDSFSEQVGAGYRALAAAIDHSTSLFVLDPQGRLAGVLLRPSDPRRVVADLQRLVKSYELAEPIAAAR